MEATKTGYSVIAMETNGDVSMETDGAAPKDEITEVVKSKETLNNQESGDGSNDSVKPENLGMVLPLVPPGGEAKDAKVLPPADNKPKASRKVARKSTAKAARNLVAKTEVVELPEANNNSLTRDDDVLESKRKDAARRLQEKLSQLAKMSRKVPERDLGSSVVVVAPKDASKISKVQLKSEAVAGQADDERNDVNGSSDDHQAAAKNLPPPPTGERENNKTPIIELVPQDSSTPDSRSALKRKRGETVRNVGLDVNHLTHGDDDDKDDVNDDYDGDRPKRKSLRNSIMPIGSQNGEENDLSVYKTAFVYDDINECPSCKTKFLNFASLKKHLRNGHEVLCIRGGESCGNLDALERTQLLAFLDQARPSACKYCGIKYKYLSCIIRHEKNCGAKPISEDSKTVDPDFDGTGENCEGDQSRDTFLEENVGGGMKRFHCLECSATFDEKSGFFEHYSEIHSLNESIVASSMPEEEDILATPEVKDPELEEQVEPTHGSNHSKLGTGFFSEPDAVPPIEQGFVKEVQKNGADAWRCVVCDMKVSHKGNLKRHYGRHTEYFYKCVFCSIRIKAVEDYRVHKVMCKRETSSSGQVKPPRSTSGPAAESIAKGAKSTKSVSAPKVVSTKCNKVLRVGGIFAKRFKKAVVTPLEGITKVYVGGAIMWKCTVCQRKEKYRSTLEKHYAGHFPSRKNYLCRYCNHKSMDEPSHDKHEQDCWNLATSSGHQLKTPKEARQANGSFKCDLCDRSFWHSYNYKRHSMTHSGVGAFKCETCGARFKSFKKRDQCCRDVDSQTAGEVGKGDSANKSKDPDMSYGDTKETDTAAGNAGKLDIPPETLNGGQVKSVSLGGNSERTIAQGEVKSKKLSEVSNSSTNGESVGKSSKIASSDIRPQEGCIDTKVSIKSKKKSPMDGLTHWDVMQWARKLLSQAGPGPVKPKSKSAKSKCFLNLKSQKCPICKRCFTSKSYLRTHLMYHARGPPEDCPYCGKSFIYHSYREKHIKTCKKETEISQDEADATDNDATDLETDATEIEDFSTLESSAIESEDANATKGSIGDPSTTQSANPLQDAEHSARGSSVQSQALRSSEGQNDSNNNGGFSVPEKQSNAASKDPGGLEVPGFADNPASNCDGREKLYVRINIHDRWMYECVVCKRLFKEHEVVVMHVKIHEKNSFHCNMCAKTLPTWTQFQRHQVMSHGVRPLEEVVSDPESDIVISDSDSDTDEEMYIDMEDDMKPNDISLVEEETKPSLLTNIRRSRSSQSRSSLGQSSRTSEPAADSNKPPQTDAPDFVNASRVKKGKKKMHPCDFCGKELASSSALYKHRLGHFGPAAGKCQICDIGFVSTKDLAEHNVKVHGGMKASSSTARPVNNSAAENNATTFDSKWQKDQELNLSNASVHNEVTSTDIEVSSSAFKGNSDSPKGQSSKGYLCPGCHKLIKSETALCTHMNLCIPDQPGSVYQCSKCDDHFMFRAAHIIHELQCNASSKPKTNTVTEVQDEPIITPTSLRKRAGLFPTTPEGSVTSNTPPIEQTSAMEVPSFERDDSNLNPDTDSESKTETPKSFGAASKSLNSSKGQMQGLSSKALRGVQALLCFECNKELKAWSLHKHVNQCCPAKATMFHTCDKCGHSVKTYAGHMIHVQLGCDSVKAGGSPAMGTAKSSQKRSGEGRRISGAGQETMGQILDFDQSQEFSEGHDFGQEQEMMDQDFGQGHDFAQGYEMMGQGQETGHAIFTAFQDSSSLGSNEFPRPIGSMEIVSPTGRPIKVEIDYNFDDKSYTTYAPDVVDQQQPSEENGNTSAGNTTEGSTGKVVGRHVCPNCDKEYQTRWKLEQHYKKCPVSRMAYGNSESGRTGMSLRVDLPKTATVNATATTASNGYKCQFCGDTFFHAALLHMHEASHSAKMHAKISKTDLKSQPELLSNRKKKPQKNATQNIKILACKVCGKEFINKQRLQRHEKIHLNVKPFKCKLCSKGFGRRDNLRQHEFLVHKVKNSASEDDIDPTYSKEVSRKSTEEALKLQSDGDFGADNGDHMGENGLSHSPHEDDNDNITNDDDEDDDDEQMDINDDGDDDDDEEEEQEGKELFVVKQQFQCQRCPTVCDSLSAIKKHAKTHSDNRPFKCDVCGLRFKLQGNLNRHKLVHADSPSNSGYVCPHCGKCYTQKLSLLSHMLTHTGERPYSCKYCPKTFAREQILKNHEKIHMEKAYECDICFKKFARKDAMKVHRLHHLDDAEKPHRCEECSRGFVTRQQLIDHSRSHTNERPYPCRYCGKPFTTTGGRSLHERLHSSKVVTYACHRCEVVLQDYAAYERHLVECGKVATTS